MIKILIFISFFFYSLAYSNDGYFKGRGDIVFPLNNNDIELISEKVHIKPIWGKIGKRERLIGWKADCYFNFYNTGNKATILIGFPDAKIEKTKEWVIKDLKSFIDGKQIETHIKKGVKNENLPNLNYEKVFVWEVTFDKNEKKQLRTEYTFGDVGGAMFIEATKYYKYKVHEGGEEFVNQERLKYKNFDNDIKICENIMSDLRKLGHGEGGHQGIIYLLKTGALWKGKIKKADIYIDIKNIPKHFFLYPDPSHLIPYYSDNFEFNKVKGRLEWHIENFEPDKDLLIYFPIVPYLFLTENHAKMWIEEVINDGDICIETIEFVKNAVFAKYGEKFKTSWLQFCYEYGTLWYNDIHEEYSDENLTETDYKILELLTQLERGYKK